MSIEDRKITEIKIDVDDKELVERLRKNNFEADEKYLDEFKKKFLECDERRANLHEYSEEILFNSQLGHWDLFDYNDSIDSDIVVKLPRPVYARDPKDDIVKNWVGIDFGYKSTAVFFRDNKEQKIIPINVGKVTGYSDLKDYENPTVMYFINFDKFLKDYNSKEGRPDTDWNDLAGAYDALNDLKNAGERSFESFLTDLKSWCSSNDIVRIKPRDNKEFYKFKPFLEIGESDLNPVEYYAYLLGLYINNMHRGKIFMRYKMSFPVYFEKKLRKKILSSFSKGIKKTFPTALIRDEKVMSQFKVVEGVEEPVAYALTALEKYNFKPTEDEEFYYSVFDFGSSCTDFDFGVYRGIKNSEDDSDEDNDYRLIHFGANRDKNLGGEKLLKYLAFEIFRINKDELFRDDGSMIHDGSMIQFTLDKGRPEGECVGLEQLVKGKSAYANRNMYNLMEKLRWAWEGVKQGEEYLEEDYRTGSIYVDLINNKGEMIPNFWLSSYKQNEDGSSEFVDLQELLRERIDKAVEKFFKSMRTAFKDGANDKRYNIKPLEEISNINIFLAGNSSKSKLFRDILNSYISNIDESPVSSDMNLGFFNEFLDSSSHMSYDYSIKEYSDDSSKDFVPHTISTSANCKAKEILGLSDDCPLKFAIYPPLGTEEARKIQQQRGYNVDIDDKTEPSGDRAISYGLLIDRVFVESIDFNDEQKEDIEKEEVLDKYSFTIEENQDIHYTLEEEHHAFEREISEKDDEIRYLKTEISSLQNKIAEQNKTTEEMRKNKNVGFSEIVPSLEKIFNLIETRSNSKMLEFAQILVDEEKKSLQAKYDEDLLKIGKLEAEKVVLENNFNEILKEKSAFEEKIALIEEEIAELKDENLKLDSDNKILYSTKANLERDLYDKNAIINRIEKDNNNLRDKLTDYKIIIHDLESKVRDL